MEQKVKFGWGQIQKEAPEWAPWIFRSWFIISKAFLGWLAATHLVSQNFLYETTIAITLLIDPIIYGISKMFGIQVEEADPGKTLIADKQIEKDGQITKVTPVQVNSDDVIKSDH